MSEMCDNKKKTCNSDELSVLKFPMKLWRLINGCRSGAICWGPFGKTILIDYELFQHEFLACTEPMFKTKNMASFVRQLNMYGFKKIHSRLPRFYVCQFPSVHEFVNDNFRMARPDLLVHVKRRLLPVSIERAQLNRNNRVLRADLARKTFEDILLRSTGLLTFWQIPQETLLEGNGEEKVIAPTYQVQAIPAMKITLNNDETAIVTLSTKTSAHRHINYYDSNAWRQEPDESGLDEDEAVGYLTNRSTKCTFSAKAVSHLTDCIQHSMDTDVNPLKITDTDKKNEETMTGIIDIDGRSGPSPRAAVDEGVSLSIPDDPDNDDQFYAALANSITLI